jgi:PadR family transcriptional regulator PadR
MAAEKGLGEFEQVVMLAVMRLGEDAYGMSIRDEVLSRTGRSVALGAIYPTLDRLEKKGFIRSERARSDLARGGRPRRMVRLEVAGHVALNRGREDFLALWSGFEPKQVGS